MDRAQSLRPCTPPLGTFPNRRVAEVRALLKAKEGNTLVFAEENSKVFITTEVR